MNNLIRLILGGLLIVAVVTPSLAIKHEVGPRRSADIVRQEIGP